MNLFLKIENLYQRYLIFINIQLRYELKFKNLLIYQQNFYTCQDFEHMHVSALRLHLFQSPNWPHQKMLFPLEHLLLYQL